ncbi:hypothetical protein ACFYZJ_17725 [Streptomyces sp. NPDC001848]|uniref:hypothetical protein n=1 Tax=Streptomyces sp. NPDC001848 TaxID=3364618 RepID=UPI00369E178F
MFFLADLGDLGVDDAHGPGSLELRLVDVAAPAGRVGQSRQCGGLRVGGFRVAGNARSGSPASTLATRAPMQVWAERHQVQLLYSAVAIASRSRSFTVFFETQLPGERTDRHPLGPVQPADLCPVFHMDHLIPPDLDHQGQDQMKITKWVSLIRRQ